MLKTGRILGVLLLVIGLATAVFLRFYQLGVIPKGINVDEASYGYDAYSILVTGKDVWGEKGLSLKSFGDYKPAGLAYTLVPLVKLFGLNNTVTRLPSALFGLATLIVTFHIAKLLLGRSLFALIATTIFALTPWHFGLSRLFYEANIGLFFIVSSIFFQLKYLRTSKLSSLILGAVFAATAGYYYAVLRYLGLALLIIALIINRSHNFKYKSLFSVFIVWIIIAAPYLVDMFSSKGLVRLQQESNLHTFGDTLVIDENRQMCYLSSNKNQYVAKFCYILWNKVGEKALTTAKVYTQLLSPKYLFLDSYQKDILPDSYGAYLEILLPLYLLGILFIVNNIRNDKLLQFIAAGWLFSPIPVALSQALAIHRNVIGLYFVFLVCSCGLMFICKQVSKLKIAYLRTIFFLIVVAIFTWSQLRYVTNYFFIYTRFTPQIWQSDAPDIMTWLGKNASGRPIYFFDHAFAPLFYSFYNRYDPSDFQENAVWNPPNQYGWTHTQKIEPTIFNEENYWKVICENGTVNQQSALLVVPSKSEWSNIAEFRVKDATGIHILREVYDSKKLYDYLYETSYSQLNAECKKNKSTKVD